MRPGRLAQGVQKTSNKSFDLPPDVAPSPCPADPRAFVGQIQRRLLPLDKLRAGPVPFKSASEKNMPRSTASQTCWVLCLAVLSLRVFAADSIESVEKAATEWVKTRTETARLQNEWTSQQELLASTVNALTERAQALEDKRDSLKAKTAKDRDEIEAAQKKNQSNAAELQAADAHLKELRDRLVQLRPSLPPRLSDALELAYRSLAATDLGSSERMQATMTVLNRCVQFNRTITYSDEVLTIGGEPGAKSYEVIYWGLSHGYALDRAAGKVWLGSPGPKGWQWEAHAEATPQVVDLIAVFKDKAEPEFAPVPAQLAHSFSQSTNQ